MKMPIRICQAMLTTSGGSSTVALGIGAGLQERGFDVGFCHLDGKAPERSDTAVLGPERGQAMARALDIDPALSGAIDLCSQLVAAYDERPFDLLHLHSLQGFGIAASLLRQLRGVPYVVTLHGSDVLNPTFLDHSADVVELLLRDAAGVTCVSHHLAGELRRKLPALDPPQVIPNFLRPDLVAVKPKPRRVVPVGEGRLLHVSSLRPVKRPELVLASFAHLRARRPGATLTLVSSASGLERARRLLGRFEVADGVHLVEAEHDSSLLSQAYQQADAFLLTSKFEGFGLVLLEALAFGRPVVAGAVRSVPEVLGADWPWLVEEHENPRAYAAALDACLNEPYPLERSQAVLARFDRETQIDRYAELYVQVLDLPLHPSQGAAKVALLNHEESTS